MKPINIKQFFLDLIFPIECIGCKKEKNYLCNECFDSIPLEILDTSTQYLDGLYSAASFNHPLLNKVIKEFKYRFVKSLVQPLSEITIKMIKQQKLNLFSPIVVPVPLSRKRLNWRGFNQAELIAKYITQYFNWEFDILIRRIKYTKPQADIENKEERKKNIKANFEINPGINLKNRDYILIDDVTTTGSTLNECARILKKNGAKNVIGITIAHG